MRFRTVGFSLIEVLISLLLVSLILLGLDGAQFYALKQAKTAYFLNVATQQLQNLTERLAASQTPEQPLALWNNENRQLLPSGFGTVNGESPNYTITIYWGRKKSQCASQQIGESGCLQENIQLASH